MHSRFAICVVLIASCGLLTIATQPAAAKIVFTPANTTLTGGHIKIDLNHDGIKDFDIQGAISAVYCGTGGGGIHGVVTVTPRTGDGVVVDATAAALASGIKVGPAERYSNSQSLMANFLLSRGCGFYGGGN